MNFFCSSADFDAYVEDMDLDKNSVLKLNAAEAIKEARATFLVEP